jgi:hypothetical protein
MRYLMRDRLPRGDEGFKSITEEPIEGATWGGQPTTAMRFTAEWNETAVRGEAYAMSYKGIGYVFYVWAPETSWGALQGEVANLRERVKLGEYREKWVEKRANSEVYSPEGSAYQLEDIDGAWLRGKPESQWKTDGWRSEDRKRYFVEDIKDLDPKGTLAFQATYRIREQGDAHRKPAEAMAIVLEIPGGGDPLEAAKAYVVGRIKKEFTGGAVPDVKLEPMTKSPSGLNLPTGGAAIGRFRFADPQDRDDRRMYIISAISLGGKTVALETRCSERDASYVEEWMIHLAGSLKAK